MNANNAASYLPLVQALADKKTVQWFDGATWIDANEEGVQFYDRPDRYRIKPEPRKPREVWVNYFNDGSTGNLHPTKEDADLVGRGRTECVLFREVI